MDKLKDGRASYKLTTSELLGGHIIFLKTGKVNELSDNLRFLIMLQQD
jgi:hypothetical protein